MQVVPGDINQNARLQYQVEQGKRIGYLNQEFQNKGLAPLSLDETTTLMTTNKLPDRGGYEKMAAYNFYEDSYLRNHNDTTKAAVRNLLYVQEPVDQTVWWWRILIFIVGFILLITGIVLFVLYQSYWYIMAIIGGIMTFIGIIVLVLYKYI
jgi:hypothetical protein